MKLIMYFLPVDDSMTCGPQMFTCTSSNLRHDVGRLDGRCDFLVLFEIEHTVPFDTVSELLGTRTLVLGDSAKYLSAFTLQWRNLGCHVSASSSEVRPLVASYSITISHAYILLFFVFTGKGCFPERTTREFLIMSSLTPYPFLTLQVQVKVGCQASLVQDSLKESLDLKSSVPFYCALVLRHDPRTFSSHFLSM